MKFPTSTQKDFDEDKLLISLHWQVRDAEEKIRLWQKIALDQDSGLVSVLVKSFSGDPQRMNLWLFARNIAFHDLTPADMIMIGRTAEVVQFLGNVTEGELFKG